METIMPFVFIFIFFILPLVSIEAFLAVLFVGGAGLLAWNAALPRDRAS